MELLSSAKKYRAIFLDRDGVIVEEKNYVWRVEDLVILPRAADAIAKLRAEGFMTVVITNQAGVARGYFGEEDTRRFNEAMQQELAREGAVIDAIYYCPHHPEAVVGEYRKECVRRKPKPGMLFCAAEDLGIDLKQSFLVGDKWSDIEAGKAAGCRTVMVKTGYGREELKKSEGIVDVIAEDLHDAAEQIIAHTTTT